MAPDFVAVNPTWSVPLLTFGSTMVGATSFRQLKDLIPPPPMFSAKAIPHPRNVLLIHNVRVQSSSGPRKKVIFYLKYERMVVIL